MGAAADERGVDPQATVEILPGIVDQGIDRDGDGWYEYLRVSVPIKVVQGAVYVVAGDLNLMPQGRVHAVTFRFAEVGTHVFDLDFDGFPIRGNLTDGPYSIELIASEDGSGDWVTHWYSSGVYSWDAFDNPFGRFAELPRITTPDVDQDGLYEGLRIEATVLAEARTEFLVVFSAMVSPTAILEEQLRTTAGPGPFDSMTMFGGKRIREGGWSGTYIIAVSVNGWGAILDRWILNRNYSSSDFEPWPGAVEGRVLNSLGKLLGGSNVSLVAGEVPVSWTVSSADGRFRIDAPESRGYDLRIVAEGLDTRQVSVLIMEEQIVEVGDITLHEPVATQLLFPAALTLSGAAVGAGGYLLSSWIYRRWRRP